MERSCWPHLIHPLCSTGMLTAHSLSKHTHSQWVGFLSICWTDISTAYFFLYLFFQLVIHSCLCCQESNNCVMLKGRWRHWNMFHFFSTNPQQCLSEHNLRPYLTFFIFKPLESLRLKCWSIGNRWGCLTTLPWVIVRLDTIFPTRFHKIPSSARLIWQLQLLLCTDFHMQNPQWAHYCAASCIDKV